MRVEPAALVFALLCASTALAHEGNPSRFNYKKHIRPIFLAHCGGCHHAGGVGPMSLLEYSEAVPWANAIKMQILGERMPPWLPVDGIGAFQHSRSLSAEEIDILVDWVVGLTPEGEPLTAAELDTDGSYDVWHMGEPDLVLAPASEVVMKEDDVELAECLVLPTGLERSRTVTELEVKPGLATVVRRATISLGKSCDDGLLIATWLPGRGSVSLPHELPAGASLAVELLYVKGWEDEGKRLTDRSEVGLRFSDDAKPVQSIRLASTSYVLDEPLELLALFPDPGAFEGTLRVEAVTPNGRVEPLLVIERYDPQWREKYILAEPLMLPSGTELRISQPTVWMDFTPFTQAAE